MWHCYVVLAVRSVVIASTLYIVIRVTVITITVITVCNPRYRSVMIPQCTVSVVLLLLLYSYSYLCPHTSPYNSKKVWVNPCLPHLVPQEVGWLGAFSSNSPPSPAPARCRNSRR